MEEHTGFLFAVMGEHTIEGVQVLELELTTTMKKLELLVASEQPSREKEIMLNARQRMAELKDLTGRIVENVYEGIKAEQEAGKAVDEVKSLLNVHKTKNQTLQSFG
jgi:hypothetical protein